MKNSRVVEDAGRLGLEVLGREGGEDRSLIGVEEADTEVVGANLSLFVYRNLRVGGQGAYVGDLAAVEYRRGRYAEAGAARAYPGLSPRLPCPAGRDGAPR